MYFFHYHYSYGEYNLVISAQLGYTLLGMVMNLPPQDGCAEFLFRIGDLKARRTPKMSWSIICV